MCHLAAMALVLPTVTLTVAGRAEAQVQQLPSWAVTEFKDVKFGNAKYGQAAADAVAGELAKTNRYDVVAQDTVKRSIETLGLTSPPEGLINLSRIGQDVRSTTIVQGDILDYRVVSVGGGKQAVVAVRMVAYDVASNLPVNGALEKGESTIRGGNVTDEALISDAIAQAAAVAVRKMQGQQLPTATVLNTTARTALINQGTRSGFKTGDTVILTRGNLQVGTARIGQIEPDQSEITIERVVLGIAPGDRVRAVFTPPALPAAGKSVLNSKNDLTVSSKPRGRSNNATLISALLVVGLVAVLLSSGNSNGTDSGKLTARAGISEGNNTTPVVRLSWTTNGFFKGNNSGGSGPYFWQLYDEFVSNSVPILVMQADRRSVVYGQEQSDETQYANFTGIGGINGDNDSPFTDDFVPSTAPTLGSARRYRLECVYGILGADLPTATASSGGTGSGTASAGTASGTATATSTTGSTTSSASTTGTAGGDGGTVFFLSGSSRSGLATPLARPTFSQPTTPNGGILTGASEDPSQTATFVVTPIAPQAGGNLNLDYVLEFSTSPSFPKGSTVRRTGLSSLSPSLAVATAGFSGKVGAKVNAADVVYYRVGVRNTSDKPGPIGDYIYSVTRFFTRPAVVPDPPNA